MLRVRFWILPWSSGYISLTCLDLRIGESIDWALNKNQCYKTYLYQSIKNTCSTQTEVDEKSPKNKFIRDANGDVRMFGTQPEYPEPMIDAQSPYLFFALDMMGVIAEGHPVPPLPSEKQ